MEATPHIGFLFALGAVWNINLNDCPGADALLGNAMRRDECHLPLDARPTLGAVSLVGPIVKAAGHKEQSFVRDKTINTDVVRCLQYAFTFQRSEPGRTLQGVRGRATESARNTLLTPCKTRVTPKPPGRCSHLLTTIKKDSTQSHPVRLS